MYVGVVAMCAFNLLERLFRLHSLFIQQKQQMLVYEGIRMKGHAFCLQLLFQHTNSDSIWAQSVCACLCASVCICVSVRTPLFLCVELLNGKSASVQRAVSLETRLVVRLELTYDLVRLFEAWIHQATPPPPPPPTVPLSADGCAPILLNLDGLIWGETPEIPTTINFASYCCNNAEALGVGAGAVGGGG